MLLLGGSASASNQRAFVQLLLSLASVSILYTISALLVSESPPALAAIAFAYALEAEHCGRFVPELSVIVRFTKDPQSVSCGGVDGRRRSRASVSLAVAECARATEAASARRNHIGLCVRLVSATDAENVYIRHVPLSNNCKVSNGIVLY